MILPVLLDSDTVSAFLKDDYRVVEQLRVAKAAGRVVALSAVTHYEIIRGLEFQANQKKLDRYMDWSVGFAILPFNEQVAHRAAKIHAQLRRAATLIADADLLIAATALEHGCAVSTNNESHFSRVPLLVVENWLR